MPYTTTIMLWITQTMQRKNILGSGHTNTANNLVILQNVTNHHGVSAWNNRSTFLRAQFLNKACLIQSRLKTDAGQWWYSLKTISEIGTGTEQLILQLTQHPPALNLTGRWHRFQQDRNFSIFETNITSYSCLKCWWKDVSLSGTMQAAACFTGDDENTSEKFRDFSGWWEGLTVRTFYSYYAANYLC